MSSVQCCMSIRQYRCPVSCSVDTRLWTVPVSSVQCRMSIRQYRCPVSCSVDTRLWTVPVSSVQCRLTGAVQRRSAVEAAAITGREALRRPPAGVTVTVTQRITDAVSAAAVRTQALCDVSHGHTLLLHAHLNRQTGRRPSETVRLIETHGSETDQQVGRHGSETDPINREARVGNGPETRRHRIEIGL